MKVSALPSTRALACGTTSDVFEELTAQTVDGVTLRIDRVGKSDRRVLLLHAMMTDGRYYGARKEGGFAHALADAGLEVYVADFRGHGRSMPPRAGQDDWSFDDLSELDLPALVAATQPHAILGHSLGGLVAATGIALGRIAAPKVLGLVSTSVWLGGTFQRRAIMTAYRGVTKLLGRAPIRALGVGTADESKTYVEQLTGWAKHRRWTSLRGIDYSEALAHISTPTFAVTGGGDWMCKPDDARAIAERIPSCEPLRIVGKQYGDPMDPDHFDLFTDPSLTTFRREIAAKLA
jgi:predicted alpha/beta hydrolase